ncbi:MAG: hypothetical protein M0033_09915 [Nitrospiraceae bacterium]|nr:hypothetical protein [Nitrospiraceae bacterium]
MIIAAIFSAALAAAPAGAGDWAPAVNPAALAAAEAPAAPAPARSGPRDGQNYSGAEELLIMEFGINSVTLDVPEAEVIRQDRYYDNAFCFEQALRLALWNLLGDYSSPTSPLARELERMGVLSTPSKSELRKAGERVRALLDRGDSRLALVRPYKLYQPLNGETVEQNWIFYLNLGGRNYWVVVDRAGRKAAYAYGD